MPQENLLSTQAIVGLAIFFGILSVAADTQRDRLALPSVGVKKLVDGLPGSERPVWNEAGGYLLLPAIPDNAVCEWQPGKSARLFLKPSGYSRVHLCLERSPLSSLHSYEHSFAPNLVEDERKQFYSWRDETKRTK